MKFRIHLFLVGLTLIQLPSLANADLNQICIRTVEWLVDNSDHIVVASEDNGTRTVQLVLKGDASKIANDFSPPESDGYEYFEFCGTGHSQILFVRGSSELLQSIPLGRAQILSDFPLLLRVIYGVTHHGRILLTESELLTCVRERIEGGLGVALRQDRRQPHARRAGVVARSDFPLETNGRTYVLVVPFTVERRDHYIQLLRTGDAATRIRAIYELRQFDDKTAFDAIQQATNLQEVRPSIVWSPYSKEPKRFTAADVANAATRAMKAPRPIPAP